jgi:hypothetical protein
VKSTETNYLFLRLKKKVLRERHKDGVVTNWQREKENHLKTSTNSKSRKQKLWHDYIVLIFPQ